MSLTLDTTASEEEINTLFPQQSATADLRLLKRGVWLYFLLLLFEGALRKWVLPGLATPLLIVRDPVALWLLVLTWKRGLLPANIYLAGIFSIGIIGIFTAVLFGHGNLFVAVYGARIFLLHFPLIFVIGRVFNRVDVIQLGKAMLWIAIPMTVLVAAQFYSPQSAWVNRGVGGDMEGAGFSGALGYFRPPATFSFITGMVQFYSLLSCFVFYFLLNLNKANKLAIFGATIGMLASIPLSISRTMLFQVGVTAIFTVIAASRNSKYLSKLIPATFGFAAALVILANTETFQTASEAFTSRFEAASDTEGGLKGTLSDRFLGGMVSAISSSGEQPFFGQGLGMGTNVGSMLLSTGNTFLIAEEEWGRLVGELGILLGIAVILLRSGLVIKLLVASYQQIVAGNLLPWILLSFGLLSILQGQWAQPTALGFSVLIGGLIIAALRNSDSSK